MITIEALQNAKQFHISCGIHKTKFGWCCIGTTLNGICHLSFWDSNDCEFIKEIQKDWPNANIEHDNKYTEEIFEDIFNSDKSENDLTCFVSGTPFQQLVWQSLIQIPKGSTTYYEKIAENIGKPKAVRAVATAIGKNSIAYIIPCHRVISKSGDISKYRWGKSIKEALINYEK